MTRFVATLAAASLLGACDVATDPAPQASAMIGCALDGAEEFANDCFVERVEGQQGIEFTVRHGDGGIRRFVVKDDKTGLASADGVFDATNTVAGDLLEVQIEDDRYLFPAALEQFGVE